MVKSLVRVVNRVDDRFKRQMVVHEIAIVVQRRQVVFQRNHSKMRKVHSDEKGL